MSDPTEAVQRLLERLQTGWSPTWCKIDSDVPQRRLYLWQFWGGRDELLGQRRKGSRFVTTKTGATLWFDARQRWALCEDGFYWLANDDVSRIVAQSHHIDALLEMLRLRWSPQSDLMSDVPQADGLNWRWFPYEIAGEWRLGVAYQTPERDAVLAPDVLFVDPYFEFALTTTGFLWLYDDEESEKVRYLGG
jgi:hypothetical protein